MHAFKLSEHKEKSYFLEKVKPESMSVLFNQ